MAVSLKSLDPLFGKIEKLKVLHRVLISVGILILIIAPFVYFSYMPQYKKIGELTKQLEGLEQELLKVKKKASELPKFEKLMKEKQAEFNEAKKSLPESEEIPSLLTSVSHSGQDAGLEFLLFKPGKDVTKGFYAEIPISIQVIGTYHNVEVFLDKVANLNRIVNVKDIRLASPEKDDNKLNVSCQAVTYKFIEANTP